MGRLHILRNVKTDKLIRQGLADMQGLMSDKIENLVVDEESHEIINAPPVIADLHRNLMRFTDDVIAVVCEQVEKETIKRIIWINSVDKENLKLLIQHDKTLFPLLVNPDDEIIALHNFYHKL